MFRILEINAKSHHNSSLRHTDYLLTSVLPINTLLPWTVVVVVVIMAFSNNHDDTHASPVRTPTEAEMNAVFTMCRQNRWNSVLNCIRSNHLIPITSMIMDNHISTTILHQAITSKGDTKARTRVIREILDIAPKAAAIKNGYGSLPLHVISQRNTKLDAPTKELLIHELVNAYKGALIEQGGVGKRTPLHIIFTGKLRTPSLTKHLCCLHRF